MQLDDKRFSLNAKNSPLSDLVVRAMQSSGGSWSTPALRRPGFEMIDMITEEDRAFRTFQENRNPALRTLAPLPDRAQIVLDNAVVEVGLQRLTVTADLLSMGLTYNITDPLSVTQLEWYAVNKVGAAQRTMTPSARGENKLTDRLPYRLPIYLTTDTFELDIRTLKMSQRLGIPLDTALIKWCTRAVNEAIEDATINGATTLDGQELKVAGYNAPGILNAPNAETQALTLAAWRTAPVGVTVFNEVQAMTAKLRANKKYGPFHLYINTEVSAALDADWATAKGENSIKQRLMKIEGIASIKSADLMPETKVALIQMTSDVIDIVVGQRPTVVPWVSLDGFTFHNLIMAIMIPRVRSDYNGDSGICIGTLA